MRIVIAFVLGSVFASGLVVGGMTRPAKVVGFLDFGGAWDPTLAFVMGSALLVYGTTYFAVCKRRDKPLVASRFELPTRTEITWQLCVGSALFGIGWGLSGFCPGPALTALATCKGPVFAVLFGVIVGNLVTRSVQTANLPSYDAIRSAGR